MVTSIGNGLVDDRFVAAELAMRDHGAQRLDDDAHADQRRDVRRIVRRRYFYDLKAAKTFGGNEPQDLQRLARQESARLRPARSRNEAAIDRVNVEGDVDGVSVLP